MKDILMILGGATIAWYLFRKPQQTAPPPPPPPVPQPPATTEIPAPQRSNDIAMLGVSPPRQARGAMCNYYL